MTANKKYTDLLKDTLIFALGNIGSRAIIFFLVPFYTYYLTPEAYGISDLVINVSQLAIPFFSFVIYDAVLRFALSRKERPQDALLVGITVWAAGSVLAFASAPLIGFYGPISSWKWYAAAYLSANMLVSIELNYLKAIHKNLTYSIICIIQTLTLAALSILFAARGRMGIRGYLISSIGSNATAALAAIVLGRLVKEVRNAAFDRQLARQMIVYSAPLIINHLSWRIIQSSDKLMLENMVGDTALGLYTVASRIPSLITVFIAIFQQAWGISSVREMDSTNDNGFYTNVFTCYSFIAFFGGLGLCTVMKPFMDLYVQSAEYGEAWRYVPLLLTSAVFQALAAYCGSMYGALKKSVNNMTTTLIAAVINIAVNYFGILAVGLWGAVIGTTAAYAALASVRLIDLRKYVHIGINRGKLIFNSCLLLAQAIAVSFAGVSEGIIFSCCLLALFLCVNHHELKTTVQRIARG